MKITFILNRTRNNQIATFNPSFENEFNHFLINTGQQNYHLIMEKNLRK